MSLPQIHTHTHTDLEGFCFPASLRVCQKHLGDAELMKKKKEEEEEAKGLKEKLCLS